MPLADSMEAIALEIRRIVEAPYLVSLKSLHNILQNVDNVVLQEWANACPNHVTLLASVVIESLQLWPYTLEILRKMSCIPFFRDAALQSSPFLLKELLDKATTSSTGLEKFSGICVTLLTDPLPPDIPLPVSAQSFFSQMFEQAVQSPLANNVEAVYLLLDGACQALLGILPQNNLDKFREHLTRMMRTVKSIEDQLLSLLCLAIIAKINRCHKARLGSCDTSSDHSSSPHAQSPISAHTWEEAQKFYTGERSLKTMHLLVLQVIYVCRGDVKMSQDLALKHVRLAQEILAAVDAQARQSWADNNKPLIRKLHEKVVQSGLTPAIQLEVSTPRACFADHAQK